MSSSQIKSQILRWINEADELLEKGDIVQASEKYYKAAEEAVKLLVKTLDLKEIIEKMKLNRRWTSSLLFDASRIISQDIYSIWIDAWYLHVYGFHEMRLTNDEVKKISKRIHMIINLLDKYLK